jgi:hypothetical protein
MARARRKGQIREILISKQTGKVKEIKEVFR